MKIVTSCFKKNLLKKRWKSYTLGLGKFWLINKFKFLRFFGTVVGLWGTNDSFSLKKNVQLNVIRNLIDWH